MTERTNYIARVRTLAKMCADLYVRKREALGFPLLEEARHEALSPRNRLRGTARPFIKPAKVGSAMLLKEGLEALRIGYSGIEACRDTPQDSGGRRQYGGEADRDRDRVKFGPPAARAFDAEGKPLPAAVGFAKSQGVDVSQLLVRKKENAELICVEKVETGRETREVLAEMLPDAIGRVPFQKRMKWGEGAFEFGRPIHWVVAILGDELIRFEIAGIVSGNRSKGHRFLSTGDVEITNPAAYVDEMRRRYVVVDEEERLAMMEEAIRSVETRTNAIAKTDADLLEEIRYITEYPHGLVGSFEEEYLDLPEAVLVK